MHQPKNHRMKIFFLILAATVSFSSAAPAWVTGVLIKQIWIAPGPTPVVQISTDESTSNIYGFYLNSNGNSNLLKLAEDAIAGNFYVKIYTDKNIIRRYNTGLSAPDISVIAAGPLYTMAISR
jgi:hypothetical protein